VRLLVTGATGFIGSRAAEIAAERGYDVAALVHTWPRAARLARLGIPMLPGDLTDRASLRRAMAGRDVVLHCALDGRVPWRHHRRAQAAAMATLLGAAAEAGIRHLVHLSSVAVYGFPPAPDAATEEGRVRYTGHAYADGKIDSERLCLRATRRGEVPATILRPTVVYGPFDPLWAPAILAGLRAGTLVLVDGGEGVCNTCYVDNLVEAMLLAAHRPECAGGTFHVSDAVPQTWRTFVEGLGRALDGYSPPRVLTREEVEQLRRRERPPGSLALLRAFLQDPHTRRALRAIPAVRAAGRVARRLSGTRRRARPSRAGEIDGAAPARQMGRRRRAPQPAPPSLPSSSQTGIWATRVVFSIARARQHLGYAPAVDFEEGIALTTAWARWAGL